MREEEATQLLYWPLTPPTLHVQDLTPVGLNHKQTHKTKDIWKQQHSNEA